jgi:hypothetical protein
MKVTNRSSSQVGYAIPDLNIKRLYQPGETKNVSQEELEKLQYEPGGLYILANFLQVSQDDAKKLDIHPEREYYLSAEGVKELIRHGSLDEFLDCLDFAPKGVIDMIRELAVTLPMTDTEKAEAFFEKTGFNVLKAIENQRAVEAEEKKIAEENGTGAKWIGKTSAPVRRTEVSATAEPATAEDGKPQRRVAADKYKIVT